MNGEHQSGLMQGEIPVGAALSAARTAQGLTVEQVAARLRLASAQISAIEAGDFSVFQGAVFSRGYVSNYARLLGLDAAPLLAVMARTVPLASVSADERLLRDATGVVMNPRRTRGTFVAVVALAAMLCGLAIYEFVLKDTHGVTPAVVSEAPAGAVASLPVDLKSEAASVVPQAPQDIDVKPADVKSADGMSADGESVGERSASGTPGKRSLHFVFSRESWVEVRDGAGNILFSKTNYPGTEQVVEGNPPFRLIVGGAGGVQLAYNGSLVNLPAYAIEDVARLRLD